jgi:hypothetical protein
VPAVAAELWSVPVNEVLARIQKGLLPSKSEYGFTLIDVAPQSPIFHRSLKDSEPRPLTFKPTMRAAAASTESCADSAEVSADAPAEQADDSQLLNWKPTRMSVSRLRRAPKPAHLAA